MMKRLIPSTVLFLTSLLLYAQTPQSILLDGPRGKASETQRDLMCNDAGTITFGPGTHTGQSTHVGPDTVFLCFGDQILIDHDAGSEDLSGDPNPATGGGVGYAFYECQPTIMGDDIPTITNDPCLYQNPFFVDPNTGVILGTISADSIWIATGEPNPDGDVLFTNDGALQGGFNGGNPVLFWFAPITYDGLNGSQPVFEGNPAGSCVNVNTAQAFPVVYLNEMTVSDIDTNAGVMGCRGSFRVSGGLPEYTGGNYASIDIRLVDDPTIQGEVISGPATHFENVVFTIPQPGTYEITVDDGKGCSISFTMEMTECVGVGLDAGEAVNVIGSQVCIPIIVTDFDSIQTLQFTVTWDSEILEYIDLGNIHQEIADGDLETGDVNVAINDGVLTISWVTEEFMQGAIIPDGETLFELCFNLIGEDDECSGITFSNSPTPFEASDINNTVLGVIPDNGLLCISDNPLAADVVPESVLCSGEDNGSFTVTIVGDNAPFTFSWGALGEDPSSFIGPFPIDQSGDDFTIGGLEAGTYVVISQDGGNPAFQDIDTVEVVQPGVLGANISFTPPLCNGEATATVMANVTIDNVTVNDTDGYSFNWAGPVSGDTQTLTNVPSGLYSVTITDPNGCTVMDNESVPEPAPLGKDVVITDATCSGSADGVISVTPTGGTTADGTYTFDWGCGINLPQGQFGSQTVNGLESGCYCCTITDDNGCQMIDTICVGANKELIANAVITDVSCAGSCDGSITVTMSTSGAPPAGNWTFDWIGSNGAPLASSDNDNMSTLTDLCPGTVRLIVSDSDPAGCELDTMFIIGEPDAVTIDSTTTTSVTCAANGMDGTANIFASGGTGGFTYDWPDMTFPTAFRGGLTPGSYMITVSDDNSCQDSIEIIIDSPIPPMVTVLDTNLDCFDDANGSLTAITTPGGAAISSIDWSTGQSGETITGLGAGTYIVTVTAEDQCIGVDTAEVIAPMPLQTDSIAAIPPDCPGFTNGSVTIFPVGGTEPYHYAWSAGVPADTFNLLPALPAGTYTVTVTDDNGCTPLIETIELEDPPSIEVEFVAIDSVSCAGGVPCDGGATVIARMSDGSSQLFDFNWDSGETCAADTICTAVMLCQGWQSVSVTDGEICSVIDSVMIPSPDPLEINDALTTSTAVTCFGDTDGTATVVGEGGTAPYTYLWDDGTMESTVTNSPPGERSVVITDANNCLFDHTITIGEPEPLVASIDPDNTNDTECAGDTNGQISILVSGGNPLGNTPYAWEPMVAASSSSLAENLLPGTYTVVVTDIRGCTDSLTHVVNEPPPIEALIEDIMDPACFGFQTPVLVSDANGGNGGPYAFFVDGRGPVPVGTPIAHSFVELMGMVTITIADSLGCETDFEVPFNQPREVRVELPDVIEVELGDSSVTLMPTLIHDSPLDSIVWTPADNLSDPNSRTPRVFATESEEYTLTIVDINGCTGTDNIFVDVDKNRNVFIPNAFTPNADGINDKFEIFTGVGVQSINFIRIFDRWGELVFSAGESGPLSPDPNGVGNWDGRVDGKVLNPGVLVYVIEVEFIDGVKLLYRGDVTVMH